MQIDSEQKKDLVEVAKKIANNIMHMPYCWEDIYSRLAIGLPLPCKFTDKK